MADILALPENLCAITVLSDLTVNLTTKTNPS